MAPIYYKHGLEQVKQHYHDIVQASDIPLIIYHFPAMTGVNANAAFYGEISKEPGVIGVKFTSMNTYDFIAFERETPSPGTLNPTSRETY